MKKLALIVLCRIVGHPTIRKPVEIAPPMGGVDYAGHGRRIDVPCRRCGRVRMTIIQQPELSLAA